MSSTVQITYDNAGTPQDITNDVIFEDASFEYQMNAIPGTFSIRVKDEAQTYAFVTGREIRLFVDGVPLFGGYVMRVGQTYPFPADDTSSPSTYTKRIWHLEGVDYNILLDNRYIRNTADYLSQIPDETGDKMDGYVVKKLFSTWSDFPAGFDTTTYVDDIVMLTPGGTTNWDYQQQGSKLRDQLNNLAAWSGAVFYMAADKAFHYHAWENVYKRWGFSDIPNRLPILGDATDFDEPIAMYGFRDVSGTEDGTLLVNDAMVWGGGAPVTETVVFARYQDEVDSLVSTSKVYSQQGNVVPGSSIDLHGRWQFAETRFNDMKTLGYVKVRASEIINGPSGSDVYGTQKGLRYPQWQFEFSWYADEVPLLSGNPNHIVAGEIVKIDLATFNVSEYMPCRTLRINFPNLDDEGNAYVLFNGEFSLQYTDPIALWQSILKAKPTVTQAVVAGVSGSSTSGSSYGDYVSGLAPYETPDNSRTVFSLRFVTGGRIGYISSTLSVYINGLAKIRGTHFTESDPANGEFTMTSPPADTDVIVVDCRTLDNAP